MYLAARSWGIQPSEFWAMTPGEWLLEAETRTRAAPGHGPRGDLSEADIDRLSALLEDD